MSQRVVIREDTAPGDLGWMIKAHGEVYASEYGWDGTFEALVARILADYANGKYPDRARAWIAEVDGRRAGCVMCCPEDETTAELHTLLVQPWARGHRLGTQLVDQCLRFARQAGYTRARLWTNHPLSRGAPYLSIPRVPTGRGGAPPQLRRRSGWPGLRTGLAAGLSGSRE